MGNAKVEVWFGDFEFVELTKGVDSYPAVIVHEVAEKKAMVEGSADSYMTKHDYSSYLIPTLFNGEILNNSGAPL